MYRAAARGDTEKVERMLKQVRALWLLFERTFSHERFRIGG